LSRNTKDCKVSSGKNPKSLSHTETVPGCDRQTDGLTDGITIVNTRYASSRAKKVSLLVLCDI